jgi:uncharacterized protein (TIGR02646 family)
MKQIKKTVAPYEYIKWCNIQKDLGVNYNFKRLPNPPKENFHEFLLREQGFICGYTMKRVNLKISHLEHFKPQHVCIQEGPGKDLDYYNLIACFPKDGMKSNCRYGAQAKDKWWENNGVDFLSPVNDACELRVIFNMNGEISSTNNHDLKAQNTISILKLKDPALTNDRKKSIHEFIFGADGATPLSPDEVKIAIDRICEPNSDGLFYEYCIAIHDALYEYVSIYH